MAECVNMYVDDTFHAHRRRGCTRLTVGSFHSLYATPDGNDVYVVRETGSGGYLCRVQPDGSGVAIGSLLAPYAPMCYAWYDGVVYYSNGITNGRIVNSAVTTWPLSSPHESEVTVQKEFYAAPYGRLMCTHNGRIYMAQGDTMWFSEYGSPQRWRLATNVMRFEGQITMLEAAGDGIYVSDSVRVYFIDQGSSGARRQQVVCHYPAILGTSSTCDGNSILRGQVVKGPSVIWTSTNGVCAGHLIFIL